MVALLKEAMQRADLLMARHIRDGTLDTGSYREVKDLLDQAANLPGAEEWAQGIAHSRFTAAHVYERPLEELSATLKDALGQLAGFEHLATRLYASAAAYARFLELGTYFEREVAAVQALPESEIRTALLDYIERVRVNVRRKQSPNDPE